MALATRRQSKLTRPLLPAGGMVRFKWQEDLERDDPESYTWTSFRLESRHVQNAKRWAGLVNA
eukprot:1660061-Pleurochrysis_carterae.AAC.1